MPTLKQKKVAKAVVEQVMAEKGSKVKNIGTIVKEAGYSEVCAKSPTKVTKTAGFKELMEQYLPDEQLAIIHNKHLHNEERPDISIKALDMAYKLKGKNAPEKKLIVNANVDLKNNPKVQEMIDRQNEDLRNVILES